MLYKKRPPAFVPEGVSVIVLPIHSHEPYQRNRTIFLVATSRPAVIL